MKRGDRVRLETWGTCYLFVSRVARDRVHGVVFDPTRFPPQRVTNGSWPLDAGWIPWHPSSRRESAGERGKE